MSLSTFVLGLWVFLISSRSLEWFAVDQKLIGFVGIAYVVILVIEAIWQPIVLWRNK